MFSYEFHFFMKSCENQGFKTQSADWHEQKAERKTMSSRNRNKAEIGNDKNTAVTKADFAILLYFA